MTWLFGYHFKWKLTKKLARDMKIRADHPEFLTHVVKEVLREQTGVDFWLSYDWAYRPIICFHEHATEKDLSDIEFSADDILCVMEILGLCHIPRWYSTRKNEAAEGVDSSEDEGLEDFLSPSERNNMEPPVPVKRTMRPKVESSSESDSEPEIEGAGMAKTATSARKGWKGESVENVREDMENLKI